MHDSDSTESDRQKAYEKLLQEALSRPGIPELLEMHRSWRDANRTFDSYRTLTRPAPGTTTTDHTNQG